MLYLQKNIPILHGEEGVFYLFWVSVEGGGVEPDPHELPDRTVFESGVRLSIGKREGALPFRFGLVGPRGDGF